jgi:hypothetical protein
VTGDERQLRILQLTVNNMQVGSAHATSANLDQDLIGAWGRHGHVFIPKEVSGSVKNHGTHVTLSSPLVYADDAGPR